MKSKNLSLLAGLYEDISWRAMNYENKIIMFSWAELNRVECGQMVKHVHVV